MFGGCSTDWKKLSDIYILHRPNIYYDMQIIRCETMKISVLEKIYILLMAKKCMI